MEAFGVPREHVSLVYNSIFSRMLRGNICGTETKSFRKEKERKENGNRKLETGNRKVFQDGLARQPLRLESCFAKTFKREGLHFALQSFPVST
jgi:hypothetical protein